MLILVKIVAKDVMDVLGMTTLSVSHAVMITWKVVLETTQKVLERV